MRAGSVAVPITALTLLLLVWDLFGLLMSGRLSMRMRNRIVPRWLRCAATLPRSLDRVRLLVSDWANVKAIQLVR